MKMLSQEGRFTPRRSMAFNISGGKPIFPTEHFHNARDRVAESKRQRHNLAFS